MCISDHKCWSRHLFSVRAGEAPQGMEEQKLDRSTVIAGAVIFQATLMPLELMTSLLTVNGLAAGTARVVDLDPV